MTAPCGDCTLKPGERCEVCGARGARPPRRLRPPPSLQALVARHGGYDKIAAQAWAFFYQDLARWRDDVRNDRAEMA